MGDTFLASASMYKCFFVFETLYTINGANISSFQMGPGEEDGEDNIGHRGRDPHNLPARLHPLILDDHDQDHENDPDDDDDDDHTCDLEE